MQDQKVAVLESRACSTPLTNSAGQKPAMFQAEEEMYQIRQRFIFDGCGCLGLPAKYYNGFAYRQVGNDHFWRCTGGAKGGFWLFVGAFLREGQEPPAAGEH